MPLVGVFIVLGAIVFIALLSPTIIPRPLSPAARKGAFHMTSASDWGVQMGGMVKKSIQLKPVIPT